MGLEPNPPLLGRKKLVGATQETTNGTKATVSAAMSAVIYDAKMTPTGLFGDGTRMPNGHYLGNVRAILGNQVGQATWRQELYHGDSFVGLLTGAGYVLSTGTYSPTSNMTNLKTWSLAMWEDGRRKDLYGCAGTATINGTNGGRAFADWTWNGVWSAPIDESMPAQAPASSSPYRCVSATLTLGAVKIGNISTFSIDLGATIVAREDVTNSAGVVHYFVEERNPTVTLDCEARKVADGAHWAALLAGTEAALSIVLSNGSATLTIAAPKAQRIEVGDEIRGGRLIDPITLQLNASSGDDELTFTESV